MRKASDSQTASVHQPGATPDKVALDLTEGPDTMSDEQADELARLIIDFYKAWKRR
jgi:hypothetical protein